MRSNGARSPPACASCAPRPAPAMTAAPSDERAMILCDALSLRCARTRGRRSRPLAKHAALPSCSSLRMRLPKRWNRRCPAAFTRPRDGAQQPGIRIAVPGPAGRWSSPVLADPILARDEVDDLIRGCGIDAIVTSAPDTDLRCAVATEALAPTTGTGSTQPTTAAPADPCRGHRTRSADLWLDTDAGLHRVQRSGRDFRSTHLGGSSRG